MRLLKYSPIRAGADEGATGKAVQGIETLDDEHAGVLALLGATGKAVQGIETYTIVVFVAFDEKSGRNGKGRSGH